MNGVLCVLRLKWENRISVLILLAESDFFTPCTWYALTPRWGRDGPAKLLFGPAKLVNKPAKFDP
jgi:hypothetical protein